MEDRDDNVENSLWVYHSYYSRNETVYVIEGWMDKEKVTVRNLQNSMGDNMRETPFTHHLGDFRKMLRKVRNIGDSVLNRPKILLGQLKFAGMTSEIYNLLIELEI